MRVERRRRTVGRPCRGGDMEDDDAFLNGEMIQAEGVRIM